MNGPVTGLRRVALPCLLGALLVLLAWPVLAEPGRRDDDHGPRGQRFDRHPRRAIRHYPPVYPQPIYVPPPVYYSPPVEPGISLFLPFNLRR